MLFGKNEFTTKFIEDVLNIAKEKKLRVIYGSLIGSLPQGIQCYDSDYDSVFLYIRDDFYEKIMDADASTYDEVLYRFYPEDSLSVWDSITYRELSSFLGFLYNPSIQGENRDYGLYYYFAEVFMSPYTWDPYGLQMKVLPLIQKCYNHEFMVTAFLNRIKLLEGKGYCDINKKGVYNYKFYLRRALYTFFLEWALKNNTFAPTYIDTVLALSEDRDAVIEYRKLLKTFRELDIKNCDEMNLTVIKEAHLFLEIKESIVIENYIRKIRKQAESVLKCGAHRSEVDVKKYIELMVNVIRNTLNEEPVKGVL